MEVEVKTKLGICPFCGEKLIADEITLVHLDCTGKWHFSHYCCDDEEGMHQASLSVSGKTRKEVIERCRASLNRKEV